MDELPAKNERNSKWCDLLDEVLRKIWREHTEPQLQTDLRRRMRAVCTSWRATVPFTDTAPRASLNFAPYQGYQLLETTYYLISPLRNKQRAWLVRAEERAPNLWRMRNPFSGISYLHYPPCIPSTIDDLFDYQVREITRSYTLDRAMGLSFGGCLLVWRIGDTMGTKIFKVHDNHLVETENLIAQYGTEHARFVDIATHENKYYAIDITGNVHVIDSLYPNDTVNTTVIPVHQCQPPVNQSISSWGYKFSNCYLVECKGQLYYIRHDAHESGQQCPNTGMFVLHDKSCWRSIDTSEVADQVIFLLGEAAFAVPTSDNLGAAGLCSSINYVAREYVTEKSYIHPPYQRCFLNCTFSKPGAGDVAAHQSNPVYFLPPPWLKGYHKSCSHIASLGRIIDG